MADDTTDTTPGPLPGVLTTGPDGSVPDLGGRRGWVWMQDTDDGGGGRFDVRSDRVGVWRRKGATVVPSYPIHFGPSGRPGKPRLGGPAGPEPARVEQPAADPASDEEESTEDQPEQPERADPPPGLRLVEPAGDDQAADNAGAGGVPPPDAPTDQAAEPAADTTRTRKGGRSR